MRRPPHVPRWKPAVRFRDSLTSEGKRRQEKYAVGVDNPRSVSDQRPVSGKRPRHCLTVTSYATARRASDDRMSTGAEDAPVPGPEKDGIPLAIHCARRYQPHPATAMKVRDGALRGML
jgi:hypothetical protein